MAKRKRPSKKKKKKRSNKEDIKTKRIAIILLLIALVGVGFFLYKKYYTEPSKFESEKYFIKGIDVSHHNPILN